MFKGGMRAKEIEKSGKEVNKIDRANFRAEAAGSSVVSFESAVEAFDDLLERTIFLGNGVIIGKPDNLNDVEEDIMFAEKMLSQ